MYEFFNKQDFDAIVTGEFTHYALWLEDELNGIISDYFISGSVKVKIFRQLFLLRDGLTFQDKIEIVRGMLFLFDETISIELKNLLKQIEEFKSWRNAMAHGFDCSDETDESNKLIVEIVTRSGKEKRIEITPESHKKQVAHAEELLNKLIQIRKNIKKLNYRRKKSDK